MKKKPLDLLTGKQPVSIRIDRAIVAFFRRAGAGWQSRMNMVLREYMERQGKPNE